jgi:hypothetical protein
MSDYFHYISNGNYNFNISLLKIPDAVTLFDDIDRHIHELHAHLNALPKLTSQDVMYLIGMFMIISVRQMRNAFLLILRRMSYDGMLLFRPGLESAVFSYRIFKDNQLAQVWALKDENWKRFSEEFRRKQFPEDMPYKDDIRKQLDLLNHYWSHPNINYFSGSTEFSEIKENEDRNKEIKVHFYDLKETNFLLSLIWFLDNCIKIIAVYRKIFQGKFPILITSTEDKYQKLLISFEQLKLKYKPHVL